MTCHPVFGCSGHTHGNANLELTNLMIESIVLKYVEEQNLPLFKSEVTDLINGVVEDLEQVKFDTGITVTSKNGSLPIPLSVKNAQTISMVEYGAVGDGTTDDSAAFALLEANISGQRINLQGKTYKIDSISRYANDYYNGYFKVGNSLITANGEFKLYGMRTTTPINIKRDAQVSTSREIYNLIKDGLSKNNVVQGFAVDEVNGYVYTHHITSTGYNHEVAIINRYNLLDEGTNTAIDYCTEAPGIGHQGISVQYMDDGSTKLWGASPYTNVPGNHGTEDSAVRYTYVPSSEGVINDIETFQVFPKSTRGGSSSPTVSYCGNYLVVETSGTVNGKSGNWIRVFDIHKMTVAGDYSNQYLSEFFVSVTHGTGDVALQSMVCDGAYIYILAGNSDINNDMTIAVYNMVGELVTEHRKLKVGKSTAANLGSGVFYEPEGMAIATINGTPRILLQIAMDDGGTRDCRVYALGDNTPIIKGVENKPSFLSRNALIDYGVMDGETVQFGTYDPTLDTVNVTASLSPGGTLSVLGGLKAGNNVTSWSGSYKPASSNATSWRVWDENPASTTSIVQVLTNTTASANFNFARWYAGGSGNTAYADTVYDFRGDGRASTDGTWVGTGADYAEYFEWADGNPNEDDRRGYLVSLIDDKIKIAENDETVIGVISSNPSIIGNSAWNHYKGKYLKDKYNAYLLDTNGCKIPNPDYDETLEYIPRDERKEWGLVGLLGRIVINDGQTIPKSWVKLSRTSKDTCEYLVK